MKTQIEIKRNYHQGLFKKGTIGVIDGYVRGGNGTPLAVVIAGGNFDLVPIHNLKANF